ncbi:MAG: carbohydrate-binding family 9-like protein [Bryobacteraceae bacterium]
MKERTGYLVCAALAALPALAADLSHEMSSRHIMGDIRGWRDSRSEFWRGPADAVMERDSFAHPVPGHRTEVRARWTKEHLYFLFTCPYEELNLKPAPKLDAETNELWNWDVAEVFLGADFQNIRHYREFEMSPQGEWVDLDVDLDTPRHEEGWVWNSGIEVAAHIDAAHKIWYGAMRIPYQSVDARPAAAGNTLRMNLYRSQGPHHQAVAWQPPARKTFHTPEAFGILRLVD